MITLFALAFPVPVPPIAPVLQDVHCSEQVLVAPAGDEFDVDLTGHPAITAGPLAVAVSGEPGERRLHTYEELPGGQGWVYRQTLTADAPGTRYAEDFHLTEEADGSLTLLVGEPHWYNNAGVQRGRVRSYRWDDASSAWQLQQTLIPTVLGWARFGATLDRDGDWLAVRNLSGDGSVHMYRRDPNSGAWSHEQGLTGPIAGFGNEVSLDGDLLVMRHELSLDNWVFRRDAADQWNSEGVLPNYVRNVQAVDGDILGVRPLIPGGDFTNKNELVVLRWNGTPGSWSEHQILDSADFPPFVQQDGDGYVRFAASDELLLVGGPDAVDPSAPTGAGRVYSYLRDVNGDWSPAEVLDRGAAAVAGENFGYHLSVDGTRGLIHSFPYPEPNDEVLLVDLDPTDCDGDLVPDVCQLLVPGSDLDGNGVLDACEAVGSVYCDPAVPNSTGQSGRIVGLGSAVLSDASLVVCADRLPANEFGYLLASSGPGNVMPGNSAGVLCLAGGADLGRYTDQVQSSGAFGQACTTIALPDVPTATGGHTLVPGETWNFQFWHRDGLTSNFTSALEVTFQ